MAKDYSKYSVNGEGKYSKSQLALEVIKVFLDNKPEATIEDINREFQISSKPHGLVNAVADIKDDKRWHKVELKDAQGISFKVSNQWNVETVNDLIFLADLEDIEVVNVTEEKDSEEVETKIEPSVIQKIRVIVRNMEDSPLVEDCPFFDLFISYLSIKKPDSLNIDILKDLTSAVFEDERTISDIKRILRDYRLQYDDVPQLWISHIDNLDITCVIEYFFDGDESKEAKVNDLIQLKEYDLDNFYESDGVYSVEGI